MTSNSESSVTWEAALLILAPTSRSFKILFHKDFVVTWSSFFKASSAASSLAFDSFSVQLGGCFTFFALLGV